MVWVLSQGLKGEAYPEPMGLLGIGEAGGRLVAPPWGRGVPGCPLPPLVASQGQVPGTGLLCSLGVLLH